MSSLHSKLIAIAETKSKSGKIIKAVALRLQEAIAQVDDRDVCRNTVEHILASYNCTPAAQKIIADELKILQQETYTEIPTEPEVVDAPVFEQQDTLSGEVDVPNFEQQDTLIGEVDDSSSEEEHAISQMIERAAEIETIIVADEITDEVLSPPPADLQHIEEQEAETPVEEIEITARSYQVNQCQFEMLQLLPNEFYMGAESEADNPVHLVRLTRAFEIATTVVTQDLYEEVMAENPSFSIGPKKPVQGVDWYHAIEFCNRLSERLGLRQCYRKVGIESLWNDLCEDYDDVPVYRWDKEANGFRLPTEAEWEYAARAETDYHFAGSNDPEKVAFLSQVESNEGPQHEVAQKQPNAWGLYDMSGLVYEWCWDWYVPLSEKNQINPYGPIGPLAGKQVRKILRGGSYLSEDDQGRVYKRTEAYPYEVERSWPQDGFRIVKNVNILTTSSSIEDAPERQSRRVPMAHKPAEEERFRRRKSIDDGQTSSLEQDQNLLQDSSTKLAVPRWPKQEQRGSWSTAIWLKSIAFAAMWAILLGVIVGLVGLLSLPVVPLLGHRLILVVLALACGFAGAEAVAQGFISLRGLSRHGKVVVELSMLRKMWQTGLAVFVCAVPLVFLLTKGIGPLLLPAHWLHLDAQVSKGDIIEASTGERWVIGGKDALNYPMPFRLLTADVALSKGDGKHQVVIDVDDLETSYSNRSWWSDKRLVQDVPRLTILNLRIDGLAAERAADNHFSIYVFDGKTIDLLLFLVFFGLTFLREKRWTLVLQPAPYFRSIVYGNIVSRLSLSTVLSLLQLAAQEPKQYEQWQSDQQWDEVDRKAWNWFVERMLHGISDPAELNAAPQGSWSDCQNTDDQRRYVDQMAAYLGLFFRHESNAP